MFYAPFTVPPAFGCEYGIANGNAYGVEGGGTPSLSFNFLNSSSLSPQNGSQGLTFSRASQGLRYRNDGLLVYAANNTLLYSNTFDNAVWTPATNTITPGFPDPNGGTTGWNLVPTAASATHSFQVTYNFTAGQPVTFSLRVKPNGYNYFRLAVGSTPFGGTTPRVISNLTDPLNPVIADQTATYSASLSAIGNGFFQVSMTVLPTVTTSDVFTIRSGPAAVNGTYTGDGVSGGIIMGAQAAYGYQDLVYRDTTSAPYYGPRYDYDPSSTSVAVDGTISSNKRGLLIEEQRSNLLLWSNDLTQAAWVKTDTTITPNSVASPEGVLNAALVTEGTTLAAIMYQDSAAITAGANISVSAYVKRGNTDWMRFAVRDGATTDGFNLWVNLASGQLGTGSSNSLGTYVSSSIQPMQNGWYRVTVNGIVSAAGISARVNMSSATADASTVRVSGATRYVYGVQVEACTSTGVFGTSYIPTVAATAIRTPDVVSSPTAGWFNEPAGTILFQAMSMAPAASLGRSGLAITDGTTANRHTMRLSSTSNVPNTLVFSASVSSASLTRGTYTALTPIKMAYAYQASDFAMSVGGSSASNTLSGNVPTGINIMTLGFDSASSQYISGWIQQFSYYPTRLTNPQLITLST